jgi:protein-S-isoprenylcysteine O-methyltransferase Ste14
MTPESVLGLAWILWFASWLAAAGWSNPTVSRPDRKREIRYRLSVIVGIVLLFGWVPSNRSSQGILWQTANGAGWMMVGVAAVGLSFTWWARIVLGKLWSGDVTRKQDHHVVDRGPYAVVRHPIYSGIILASLATAVMRGTALAFAGVALTTVSWYIKARLEESFLREQLGSESYDTYARRVPMLIPFAKF